MVVTCGGQELSKVRSRKGLWLLALLALRANQQVPREWAAATLWPDSEDPRQTLRRTLTDLRTALGDCGNALTATTQSISLCVPESLVDVLAFDSCVRKAGLADLEAAIALYKGPVLRDCGEVWCESERIVRGESYIQALQSAARLHSESGGALSRAITYLRLGIEADPFRESLYRDLMLALAANSEPAEGIQVYRALRVFLRDETRTEPSAATTAIYQRLQSPGQFRQRAGVTPARDAPTEHDPILPPTNLPSPLTGLIGREREMGEVTIGLAASRLVTLAGMGGLGKTRLAIETAARQRALFPDGVWFVDLAPITDEALVARATAAVLAVREEAGKPLSDSMVEVLRDRRMLIVMDNCEHLIDAASRLIRDLLSGCSQLHILATSRQALGLTGEIVMRLEPLALPSRTGEMAEEPSTVAQALSQSPAVSLFAERATAAQPGFAVSPQNLSAVTEICRRLDGIPLALELVAARVRSLSVEQISTRLEDRFRLLTSGSRSAPQRQQTLRGLVDWSFDLLAPEARLLFARLSIFAGGWSLEAAEEVCSDREEGSRQSARPEGARNREMQLPRVVARIPDCRLPIADCRLPTADVLDLLSDLVEKSLVLAEAGPDGEIRYRMLETLRQYAAEKLEEFGEREPLRKRHLQWCIRFAEAAESEMRGPNQTQRLREAMRDNDNLRQALQEAGPGEKRLRLAVALFWHWYIHGFYAEGRTWLERALEETPEASVQLKCRAMKTAGDLCWAMGDMAAAQHIHEQNMLVQCEANDRRGVGMTYNSLGLVAYHQGDCITASAHYRKGLAILRELDDSVVVGVLLMNLALPTKEQGDYLEAEALLAEADAIHRKMGNSQGLAVVLHSRCLIAKRLGEYERALKFIDEAVEIDHSQQNLLGEAVNLHTRGEIAFYQGDLDGAERSYRASLDLFTRIGAKRSIAAALCSLGEVCSMRGEMTEARRYHLESLEIESSLGNRIGIVNSLRFLAAMEHSAFRSERAARLLGSVDAAIELLGTPMPPNHIEPYERLLADVRATLGDALFEEQWRSGSAMPLDAAVAEAREGRQ